MTVAKIMRKDVVALRPEERIDAAWPQMRALRLEALPVADATDRLVGLLTGHDLLGRLAPRRVPRWWNEILAGTDRLAAEYVRSVGLTVGDLMTLAPVTVWPDAPVEVAATLMRQHAIGVLPVIAEEVYRGLVTRAEVLVHLRWPTSPVPGAVADSEIERLMQEGLVRELWTSRHRITVEVTNAIIRLTGVVAGPLERTALLAMARAVPGCAGVEDRLAVVVRSGSRPLAPVI
jgi:CBS domain-containing protein